MEGPTDETMEAAFKYMVEHKAMEGRARIETRVGEWLAWRRDALGREGVDYGHSCTLGCRQHILRIDPQLQLYGCNLSGRTHLCQRRAETCLAYYVDEATHFCVFTGFSVGGQEMKWRYARKDKNVMGRRNGDTGVIPTGKRKKPSWNPFEMRKRRKRVPNKVEEAKLVLDIILWDRGPRKRLHTAALNKAKSAYGGLIKEYVEVSIRNGRMITMHVLDRIVDAQTAEVGPSPLTKDLGIHQAYSEWIVKMWNVIQAVESPQRERFRVRFEQHAVGMLYRLRNMDITKDGVVILAKDPWLARNLPAQNDLQYFRPKSGRQPFTKNDITKGIKHLVMSLMLCEVPGEELAARF